MAVYAVRDPEPGGSAANTGDVAAGFWCDCLPFACSATLTVAVTTLDVITDCLLFRAFQDVGFPESLQDALIQPGFNETQSMVWQHRGVYLHLPLLLQIFCLLGALVYMLDLLWMSWMFIMERRKFKDRRDGLPHKGSVLEKHGSDVFILLHVSLHDLPVPALFLAAQMAVSCRLVLQLGHVIFYLAMLSTAVSVSWKTLQVVYNSGCLGQREEYICAAGSWVLRSISVVLLLGALVAASLNIVLLTGWRDKSGTMSGAGSQITDKIRLDSWLRGDAVFLAVDPALLGPTTDGGAVNATPSSVALLRVASMADIFASQWHRGGLRVEMGCHTQGMSLTHALGQGSDVVQSSNCSAIFLLKVAPAEGVLYFDYYFRFTNPDGTCTHSRGQRTAPHISLKPRTSPIQPGQLPSVDDNLILNKEAKTSEQTPFTSHFLPTAPLIGTSEEPPGETLTTVTLSDDDVSMAKQLSETTQMFISRSSRMKCSYNLVQNTSMVLDNPCNSYIS